MVIMIEFRRERRAVGNLKGYTVCGTSVLRLALVWLVASRRCCFLLKLPSTLFVWPDRHRMFCLILTVVRRHLSRAALVVCGASPFRESWGGQGWGVR